MTLLKDRSCLLLLSGFCVLFFISCSSVRHSKRRLLNLDFRALDSANHPTGWRLTPDSVSHYDIFLDSAARGQGYAAFCMRKKDSTPNTMEVFARFLPLPVRGDTLEFSASIKTEGVTQGTAGLIAMVLDKQGQKVSYRAMVVDGESGTHDWTRRFLKLPIDPVSGDNIYIIGILTGNGRAWIGNLQARVDGRPLESLQYKLAASDPGSAESLGKTASAALTDLSPEGMKRLVELGMLWGFLKYYHPAIEEGKYDWDSALFRILPSIVKAPDDKHAYELEERWIRQLGKIPECKNCVLTDSSDIKVPGNYGFLFDQGRFPKRLREQLVRIRENHVAKRNSYYVSYAGGYMEFIHEEKYRSSNYPAAAIRLLGLYRYWNTIQYYYPYRYLIKEDWNTMLAGYLPRFLGARDSGEYVLSCLELIGHIHDTHANIWNQRTDLDSIKGRYRAPFEAVFAEGRLVVTRYLVDSPDIRRLLPLGAIIRSINGVSTDSLVRKFLPFTPASNEAAQLRDLPSSSGFLLRSNRPESDFEWEYRDSIRTVRLPGIGIYDDKHWVKEVLKLGSKGVDRIGSDVGYIRPDRLSPQDFPRVRKEVEGTRGLVIDLRYYPSTFMVFNYASWLKAERSAFAFATSVDTRRPGCMSAGPPSENGGNWGAGKDSTEPEQVYKGRVILLVDANTQSRAEYTTMAFQSAPNVRVVGSTTAGADGNVSYLWFPGNVLTMISGLGIYYPDGGETQRVGVRIDVPMKVTVKGLQEGRDEFLEAAIRMIRE
ncbi:MAG: hypothetical protein JST68_30180 [Bacteroidetes bacterium]|nr:hypothetical protein [Bacteroidota bacterium]